MTTTDPIGRAAAGWHALPVEEVQAALGVRADGLGAGEARERLARHGPNRLPAAQRRGPLARLLAQFHNVLIYVLLGAGGDHGRCSALGRRRGDPGRRRDQRR